MVKHNHGKRYIPLGLPVFVELGMEQYHSLYKNLQYWGLVQKICLAVMKGLKYMEEACRYNKQSPKKTSTS